MNSNEKYLLRKRIRPMSKINKPNKDKASSKAVLKISLLMKYNLFLKL